MTVSLNSLSSGLATLLGKSTATSESTATTTSTIKSTATSATTATGGATISAAAKIAAAEAAENKKDFAMLGTDTRAALDAQKKAGKDIDLSELSGRALAAMILDKADQFSPAETAAAKTELRTRSREEFTTAIGGTASLTSLSGYNQLLVSEYDSMSTEEREARGWTATIRNNAAAFVATASGTSTSSLFDLLNGND